MRTPTVTHWQALKRVLRYLKGTSDYGIRYTKTTKNTDPALRTFADADFANASDRKSYSGSVHNLYGSPIMWSSSKQKIVSVSTSEAEYISASLATQHANWLKRLFSAFPKHNNSPVQLYLDNKSAILVGKHTAPTKRRKYIDIKHHHIRSNIDDNKITMHHIPSQENPADLFTKPLGPQRFKRLTAMLKLTSEPPAPPGTVSPHVQNATGTSSAHVSPQLYTFNNSGGKLATVAK